MTCVGYATATRPLGDTRMGDFHDTNMLRIFDINGQYFTGRPAGREGYRRLLAEPSLAGLVLSGIDLQLGRSADWPFMSNFRTSNREVLDFVAALDDARVVPFFFVDPRRPDAARTVEQAFRDGFKGLKMYPPQGWDVDEPRVLDAFRAAEAAGAPVFLHMGRTASHPQLRSIHGMPGALEGLGLACPRLDVIVGHFAGPWGLEACHLGMSFRFYFDLSTSGSWDREAIRFAARSPYLGVDRLVLGTNADGTDNLKAALWTVEQLRSSGLSEAEIQKVACDNARKLLGLA